MEITCYQFGRIEIDSREYRADVVVTANGVRDNWRRRQGHNLEAGDLDCVMEVDPEILIIGSGYYGRMKVAQATCSFLESTGMRVEVMRTAAAVARFNELARESVRTAAALHLTC